MFDGFIELPWHVKLNTWVHMEVTVVATSAT